MSKETVALPGDADEPGDQLAQDRKDFTPTEDKSEKLDTFGSVRSPRQAKVKKDPAFVAPSGTPADAGSDERGPLSPAQHEDDGWGDTPVQMRG